MSNYFKSSLLQMEKLLPVIRLEHVLNINANSLKRSKTLDIWPYFRLFKTKLTLLLLKKWLSNNRALVEAYEKVLTLGLKSM